MKSGNHTIHHIQYMFVSALFAAAALVLCMLGVPREIEQMAKDAAYQKLAAIPGDIKIIAVDEVTLAQLGPYADWDRSYFANLIERLNADAAHRPKVIAFDFIFSGTNDSEADWQLASAAEAGGNVLLASKLELASAVQKENGTYLHSSYVAKETRAYDALSRVAVSGFTTPLFDADGYVRSAYGRIISEGQTYTSFALAALEMAGEVASPESVYAFLYSGKPGEFEQIPMSMVLDGTVPASYFSDCIVLVGACEEGFMDAHKVPVDHSMNMYGVEIQANEMQAMRIGAYTWQVPGWLQGLLGMAILLCMGSVFARTTVKRSLLLYLAVMLAYPLLCMLVFLLTSWQMHLLYIPVLLILQFGVLLLVRYVAGQKERAKEMQKMLFSMADSMAEAIEGRTPYNANHTKNVAKRCMEMLDYINEKYKKQQGKLHFTENDKRQLYLAAMLHDIGKMDVPTEVMDKPTRLGAKTGALRDRLTIIRLSLMLEQRDGREEMAEAVQEIDTFLANLDSYDCGRPLKEEELSSIAAFGEKEYVTADGVHIPYLLEEERTNLRIKAGTLSAQEREIMQSHVSFTDKILSHVYFGKEFDKVRRIAADHHELLNAKGYPKGKSAQELDGLTRILTIMDIYDSLIADDRPYKKAKPNAVAFDILNEEAAAGKIDAELLEIAKELYLYQK